MSVTSKTKKKNWLIGILAVLFLIAVSGLIVGQKAFAKEAEFPESVEIKTSYILGETIEIPQTTISDGEKDYTATHVAISPGGKAFSANKVLLNEEGEWSLRYTAKASGKVLFAQKSFKVNGKKFSAGDKSKIVYDEESGNLKVSLASGETFRYNEPVNLTSFLQTDKLISMFASPEADGEAEVKRFYIDFIDAYDKNNVIRITVNASTDNVWPTSYLSAGVIGKSSVGLLANSKNGTFTYEGIKYVVHANNGYGTNPIHSFTGKTNLAYGLGGKQIALDISWDYSKKAVYSYSGAFGGLITLLDNTTLYTEAWQGFKNGEVFVSITGGSYVKSAFNMQISEFFGTDLSEREVTDTIAPEIYVDLGEYDESNLPVAQSGMKYPVNATAYDVYDGKEVEVNVKAYYNYTTANPAALSVKDGYVTPDRTGEITLVYEAKDAAGNKAEKTLKVLVVNAKPLEIKLEGETGVCKAGEAVKVKDCSVESIYPEYNISVYAALSSDKDIVYEIDSEKLEFTPLYSGTYEIVYTAVDYVETTVEKYTVTVEKNDKSLILAKAALPRYFIKGATYSLPALNSVSFATGVPSEELTTVSVSEDGASAIAVDDGKYTVNANSSVKVIYTSKTGEKTDYAEIPVVDVNYGSELKLDKYFAGEGFDVKVTDDGVALTKKEVGNGEVEFINSVLADFTRVEFTLPEQSGDFGSLLITLTDSENENEKLAISYKANKNGFIASVNENGNVAGNKSLKGGTFNLYYDNANLTLFADQSNDGTTELKLPAGFTGFGSGRVFITVEILNAQENTEIIVQRINNQQFGGRTEDDAEPQFARYSRRGSNSVGKTIDIKGVIAGDVLDPDIRFYLIITAPSGGAVTDLNGSALDGSNKDGNQAELSHSFKLEQYGNYTVYYYAADASNNEAEYSYVISAVDDVAPKIVLSGKKTKASVGDTVEIAQYKVSDNRTENMTVSVFLTLPDGRVSVFKGDAFYANRKGKFTVSYYVEDEDGNTTIVSYDIIVE